MEPNPPRLFHNRAEFTSAAVSEPLVWVAILDLFIQDTTGCAQARAGTLAAIRAAISHVAVPQIELPAQDLSPDCRQRGERALDVPALQAALASARNAFRGAHVRPLIIYVDDVEAQLPPDAFNTISAMRAIDGNHLWTVSFDGVFTQLGAERQIAWTYAGDPALAARLDEAVKADLPLQSTATATSGPVPLLGAAQLDGTREFRLCGPPRSAVDGSYPEPLVAHALDRGNPPTVNFAIPQAFAMPKTQFGSSTFTALVEGCTANCDRFFIREPGDDPSRWDQMTRCALVADK